MDSERVEFLVSGLSLPLQLRVCSERSAALSQQELSFILSAALTAMRPTHEENLPAYKELKEQVDRLLARDASL